MTKNQKIESIISNLIVAHNITEAKARQIFVDLRVQGISVLQIFKMSKVLTSTK